MRSASLELASRVQALMIGDHLSFTRLKLVCAIPQQVVYIHVKQIWASCFLLRRTFIKVSSYLYVIFWIKICKSVNLCLKVTSLRFFYRIYSSLNFRIFSFLVSSYHHVTDFDSTCITLINNVLYF